MEKIEDKNQAELIYQKKHALKLSEVSKTPDYVIERYNKCKLWFLFQREFLFKCLKDKGVQSKAILDFGCGEGEIATYLAKFGGHVTAIDISPDLIRVAKRRAELDSTIDRIQFLVGDILKSQLPYNKFDFVICNNVLHHVDIQLYFPKVLDALKETGYIFVTEPIAFSPLLQKLRDAIPIKKDISPGERQLSKSDVKFIIQSIDNGKTYFFNLFGRLARLFENANKIDRGHLFTKIILVLLFGMDRILITIFPFLSKFYGVIVIIGEKSRKSI